MSPLPADPKILRVVSISGGKDSLACALLAKEQFPIEQIRLVGADTGNEHELTMDYVTNYLPKALGMPIHIVRAEFSEQIARKREYIGTHWMQKLLDGRPGKWTIRQKWRDQAKAQKLALALEADADEVVGDIEEEEEAEAPASADKQIPPPPSAPADIYGYAATEFYKWMKARAPVAEAVAKEICERAYAATVVTGNPYLDMCVWKGRFPSRRAQFCTEHLKTIPLSEHQLTLIDQGFTVESWQGVRADESANRAKLSPSEERGGGLHIWRPILRWTGQQAIDFALSKGIKPNPLYSMGMNRVGCMPCINCSKDELLQISQRCPGHIERIAMWEQMVRLASMRGAASFFPAPGDGRGDLQGDNITKRVQWSKTSRGGKQLDLMRQNDGGPKVCASSYGLCE